MSGQPEDDPIAAETARLVQLLGDLVRTKRVSVRSLEKRMGVGDSVFAKLLKGKITLQVRHVLMLCQALEIEPKEFFAAAYGFQPAPAPVPVPEDLSQKPVTHGNLEKILTKVFVGAQVLTPKQAEELMARILANGPEN